MNVIIHISTVVTDGRKVLMVKENKEWCYGWYNFPGGHHEPNENILEGAYREIIEETSVEAKIDYLINILITKGETTYINFVFHANYISGETKPQQGEILECRWIEIHDLINGFDGELLNKEKKIKVLNDFLSGKQTELEILVNF